MRVHPLQLWICTPPPQPVGTRIHTTLREANKDDASRDGQSCSYSFSSTSLPHHLLNLLDPLPVFLRRTYTHHDSPAFERHVDDNMTVYCCASNFSSGDVATFLPYAL